MKNPRQSKKLQAKRDALDAWSKLPQGTPSRDALPPAGGGQNWLLGIFVAVLAPVRERKWFFGIALAVIVIGVVIWQLQ